MEGDEVQTFGIEPKIWTMTTMSLAEKKSKFREMELKHEVNNIWTFIHFYMYGRKCRSWIQEKAHNKL